MNDPYQEMAIKNGVLEIKFHLFYNMGSWYVTNSAYKFRYQQHQFVLIGADNFSFIELLKTLKITAITF